jgi:hypothetical protein
MSTNPEKKTVEQNISVTSKHTIIVLQTVKKRDGPSKHITTSKHTIIPKVTKKNNALHLIGFFVFLRVFFFL